MYKSPVILNSAEHKNLRVTPVTSYGFARALNSCIILGPELFEAAKCYPIIFSKSGDHITPVVMLGIGNNFFITPEGKWEEGQYVPAFARRYPYILAEGLAQDGSLTVCIDAGYQGFNAEDGERLFNDEGQNTPALDAAINFLRLYHAQFEATKDFVSVLTGLNILKEVDANIALADGQKFTIRNMMMVDEKALQNLADDSILTLFRRGYLAWIYAHLHSLSNFNKILAKGGRSGAAGKDASSGE